MDSAAVRGDAGLTHQEVGSQRQPAGSTIDPEVPPVHNAAAGAVRTDSSHARCADLVEAKVQHQQPVPGWAGGLALGAGALLLVIGLKRR